MEGYGRVNKDTVGYGRIEQGTEGYGRVKKDTVGYGRIGQGTEGYRRVWKDTTSDDNCKSMYGREQYRT